jgi:catechol 2,3-dioxygenase-like lactoylglutathione lyase family enzyme
MAFVATADAGRCRRFYADVLGLRLIADEDYALVFDAHGTMLRIQKVQRVTPAQYTVLGWHVADITRSVAALREKGVVLTRYPFLEQDESGIWSAPDGAKVAWFKDPDGNVLSLSEVPVLTRTAS